MTEVNISPVLANKIPIPVINIIMEYVSELKNSQWKPIFVDDNKRIEMIWKVNKFNNKNNGIINTIQLKKKNTNQIQLHLQNSFIGNVMMTDVLDFYSLIENNKLYKRTYYLQYFHHGFPEYLYLTFERIEKENDGVKEIYCNSSGLLFRPYLQDKYRCEKIEDWILMYKRLFIYNWNPTNEFTGNWEYNLELNIWEYIGTMLYEEEDEGEEVEPVGIHAVGEVLY